MSAKTDIDHLTTTEAAKQLGCSRSEIRRKILSGVLKAVKIGRDWHIWQKDLDALPDSKGAPRKGYRGD